MHSWKICFLSNKPINLGLRCLLHFLEKLGPYIFPTFSLVLKVLINQELEQMWECILIVQLSPSQQQEIPKLLQLLVQHPINLPKKKPLLRKPELNLIHPL